MKKKMKAAIALSLSAALAVPVFAACGGGPRIGEDGMAILDYPDFEETPNDKNSWEYIPEGTDLTIDWYVDVSSWSKPAENDVVRKIKADTGITVNFSTPVQDDGQKLATMVAGGDLPDVISATTASTQTLANLAQQGYVYDINTLADKWAPTLYDHLPGDVMDWWAYGNGKTYGIPNHYYSYEDIPKDERLQPNGGMMVRKDIFDAWQTHVESTLKQPDGTVRYTGADGSEKTVEWQGYITTPEGFKAASVWAMENYCGTGDGQITTALQLGQFAATGNASINWLAQFFAVPFEDEEGNYIYRFTSDKYAEVLYYLNDLYTTKVNGDNLISNGNFTQNYDGVGQILASGRAFASLATPQDYQMHYLTAKDKGYEYISLYITNENGDAPVLQDIRGYGYLFNMISTKCKRPDIVIKLFDYLSSEQGQNLICFGVEGDTWNYNEKHEIEYTQRYLDVKSGSGTVAGFGCMLFDLLINYQYYDNVQPRTNNGKTEGEIFRTDLKRPLSIYAYDYNATAFFVDATNKNYQNYSNSVTRVDSMIRQQLPKILKAKDRAAAEKVYAQTIDLLKQRNLALVIELESEAYRTAKQKLGISVAWPPYQEGYSARPDRTQPNGDLSLYRGTY